MGKLLKDHEMIGQDQFGGGVYPEDRLGYDDSSVRAGLVLREVLDPVPSQKCIYVRCSDPRNPDSRTPITLSYGVEDMALQRTMFKFLRNQRGKTIEQIREMQVDF